MNTYSYSRVLFLFFITVCLSYSQAHAQSEPEPSPKMEGTFEVKADRTTTLVISDTGVTESYEEEEYTLEEQEKTGTVVWVSVDNFVELTIDTILNPHTDSVFSSVCDDVSEHLLFERSSAKVLKPGESLRVLPGQTGQVTISPNHSEPMVMIRIYSDWHTEPFGMYVGRKGVFTIIPVLVERRE